MNELQVRQALLSQGEILSLKCSGIGSIYADQEVCNGRVIANFNHLKVRLITTLSNLTSPININL